LRRLCHPLRLGDRVGERLLAQHVLARLQRRDGDLGVALAGGADVDELHVVACDQLPPVGLGRRPAQLVGRDPYGVGVPAADGRHPRSERQVEDPADGAPPLGVGRSHEGVADHSHAERWRRTALRGPGRFKS
jgi:hypothetical protein